MYDVIIIGAGVVGAAAARELSRYCANVCVLEREEDVCSGTSKANSGIVHAGYDAKPGTRKAKMNLSGNAMMERLSEDLDVPFIRNGSLVICTDEGDLPKLQELCERGRMNEVPGIRILDREEARRMEPNVTEDICAALYAPTGGIICPFSLTIALAENANKNGVEFFFNTEVTGIEKLDGGFRIRTSRGEYETRCVVNAAGVYADVMHNMVSSEKLTVIPRKGEYYLLDKSAGKHVSKTIFALPGKYGKGVLVTPTVHGNLLIGPTSTDIEDKEGTDTTAEGLAEVIEKSGRSVEKIPVRECITSFAGLRAHEEQGDFVIGEVADVPGFFDCAGIESPGLTSAPAIGKEIAEQIKEKLQFAENPEFDGTRKGIVDPSKLSLKERNELIARDPAYGTIICRCEGITEGEIIDAVRRPLGARSLDGVKRRTRAGMGRCQSGFCMPKTMEILVRELSMRPEDITKCGGGSEILVEQSEKYADKEVGK